MVMLYLLVILALLYIINIILENKWELIFIKNTFGLRFYNLFMRGLNYSSSFNKLFIIIIWIILFVSSVNSTYFAYFLRNNIETISNIVTSK